MQFSDQLLFIDLTRFSRFPLSSLVFIRVYLLAFVSPFYSTLSSSRSCSFLSLSLFVFPLPFVHHPLPIVSHPSFRIRTLKDAVTKRDIIELKIDDPL